MDDDLENLKLFGKLVKKNLILGLLVTRSKLPKNSEE